MVLVENEMSLGPRPVCAVSARSIGHVNEYPTKYYFRIPRLAQSLIAFEFLD